MATVEPKRRALSEFLAGVVGVAPEWSPAKAAIPQVVDIVMKAGIQEAVDLIFLDENELTSMLGNETQLLVARLGGQAAMGLRGVWAQNAASTTPSFFDLTKLGFKVVHEVPEAVQSSVGSVAKAICLLEVKDQAIC